MDQEKPNYYAIIPANVRYDEELTSTEKLLYAEITCLTEKTGECWASNNYFSNLYRMTNQSISRCIRHLKEKGYISIDILYKEKSKEIEKRIITLPINNNVNTYKQKNEYPINNNVKENNTSNNNINNMNIIYNWEDSKICECKTNKNEKCVRRSTYCINGKNYCNQHSKYILGEKFNINNKKDNIFEKKYFEDEELNNLFIEFLGIRKKIKAVNSERAITTLVNKLNKYPKREQKVMLEKSIVNCWKDVYELKDGEKPKEERVYL